MRNDPFATCSTCVVGGWCKLRTGEVRLPETYVFSFCVAHDKLERAFGLSGIAPEYKYANKRNFQLTEENKHLESIIYKCLDNPVAMVENGINVAIVHPNKGTGKTYLACAIHNEFIFKVCRDPQWFDYENPVAMYTKFGSWANALRNTHALQDEDFTFKVHRTFEQMKEVPLLVIDDIGSGRITPIVRDYFYDLIDYRKEHKKSTIYTSNFTEEQLRDEEMLGEMIVSRMFYNTIVIPLGGEDRRKVKRW